MKYPPPKKNSNLTKELIKKSSSANVKFSAGKSIIGSLLFNTIFISSLFLFVVTCSEESVEPSALGDLTGVWELKTTMKSNSCGEIDNSANYQTISLIQCGNEVTVITESGFWGTGTAEGKKFNFSGTEILIDSTGCQSTNMSHGTLEGTSELLDGSFTSNISFDPLSCGNADNCIIEFNASVSLLGAYFSGCIDRDTFGEPTESEYILPWPSGKSYLLNNSYCAPLGGHRQQMAYDFLVPIGDTIIASRAGIVRKVKENSPDNGQGTDHNHVMIEHSDGTVGFYAHLKQNGVLVEVGESVNTGEVIALAGHSGTPDVVHLHFGVYGGWPPEEGFDRAINFNNTDGLVDCKGGLIRGEMYKAL